MHTYIYYIAEKVPGAMEMQRFAHPIHVGLVTASEERGVKSVLNAAALTYVAGALAALTQLLYFALMFLGDQD